jgi:large subunit ribosomal protein L23
MSANLFEVIKKPLVTEKNTILMSEQNQYGFQVDIEAKKPQIKKAVEKIFKVKVKKIRTLIIRGKTKAYRQSLGKRPNWKKAYVTLAEGQKIELFEGV